MDSFPYIVEKYFSKTNDLNLEIQDVNYIYFLSSQKNHFQRSINSIVDHIFSEAKLELCDVPRVILEISEIVKKHMKYYNIQTVQPTRIIKFIMYAIIESEVLEINYVEILHVKKMTDVSLDLVEFDIGNAARRNSCFLFC